MAEEEKETNKSYFAIIPANVRYDKELPMGARLLYGEFTALSNQKGYCYASNSYFAELYDVTPQAISKWINTMANKGYIKLEYGYNKYGIKERRIYIQVTVPPKKDKDEKEEKEETKDSKKVSTQVDEGINIGLNGINIGLRGYQHRIKQNNTDNNKFNNTPNNTPSEDSSLHSESSCEEPNDTDKKETQTDTLITKNKMSEQSDKADRPEEKEIDMNSDSQTPPDGPAPWEKPAKKSKPKVPLPDREPVNDIEKVFKEYMRMFDSAKQEGLVSGNYCWGAANYGARVKTVKFWLKEHSADEIKQALWLAKKDNFCLKTLGLSFMPILSQKVFPRLLEGRIQPINSGRPQKYKEAFVDGKRDYSDTDW